MEPKLDMIQCLKCGKVREKFLVGCPNCGAVENREIDSSKEKSSYEITLQTIQRGKEYYKKELSSEQRTWFSDRIPNGQSWQFYAGIVLINNLNVIWIKELLPFETYSQPISCGNSRVFFIMSFMTIEKQQNFCDMINTFNHERIKDDKRKTANIPQEDVEADE